MANCTNPNCNVVLNRIQKYEEKVKNMTKKKNSCFLYISPFLTMLFKVFFTVVNYTQESVIDGREGSEVIAHKAIQSLPNSSLKLAKLG